MQIIILADPNIGRQSLVQEYIVSSFLVKHFDIGKPNDNSNEMEINMDGTRPSPTITIEMTNPKYFGP